MNPIYMATKHETFLYDTHKVEHIRNQYCFLIKIYSKPYVDTCRIGYLMSRRSNILDCSLIMELIIMWLVVIVSSTLTSTIGKEIHFFDHHQLGMRATAEEVVVVASATTTGA